MSLFYHIKAIHHHLRSKNRHGTHSPHVYRLLDEYVYQRRGKVALSRSDLAGVLKNNRDVKFVGRVLPFFNISEIKELGLLEESVTKNYKGQIIIIRSIEEDFPVSELLHYIENGAVLLWEEVYNDRLLTRKWKEFIQMSNVTVSLDFFHICFAYHKSTQRKEQFSLKYPYGY